MKNDFFTKLENSDTNARHPYLEITPADFDKLEWLELLESERESALFYLEKALSEPSFEWWTEPQSAALAEKIAHHYFSLRNKKKISQQYFSGIGYPVFLQKDGRTRSGLRAVPVFIFPVVLTPDKLKTNRWHFSFAAKEQVCLNPFLEAIFPGAADFLLQTAQELSQRTVDLEFLHTIARTLAVRTDGAVAPGFAETLSPFPELESLLNFPEAQVLFPAGVLTIFEKKLFLPTPPMDDWSVDDWINEPLKTTSSHLELAFLAEDSIQKNIREQAASRKITVVEGLPGSGQNQVIVNQVMSNLINGQSTLIISPSMLELERLATRLSLAGLTEQFFFFKHEQLDPHNLAEQVVGKANWVLQNDEKKASHFLAIYRRFDQQRQLFQQSVNAYQKNIFDVSGWAETVGLFLKNNQSGEKDLLEVKLKEKQFEFTTLEYEELLAILQEGKKLMQPAFAYSHPLDHLSDALFAEKTGDQPENIRKKLEEYRAKGEALLKKYFTVASNYKTSLKNYFQNHYYTQHEYLQEARQWQEEFQWGSQQEASGLLNRLGRRKKTQQQSCWQKCLNQYRLLKKNHQKQMFFSSEVFEQEEPTDFEQLESRLDTYEEQLDEWFLNRNVIINQSCRGLSSHSALLVPEGVQERLKNLENGISEYIKQVNAAELFHQEFKIQAMTLPLQHNQLEEIVSLINQTLFHLRDFSLFSSWRSFCSRLPAKGTKLLEALVSVPVASWESAFNAWYFHHLLEKQAVPAVKMDALLEKYTRYREKLLTSLPVFLKNKWHARCKSAIHGNNRKERQQIAAFLNQTPDLSEFPKWLEEHFDRLTVFFPVLLMPLDTALQFFRHAGRSKRFDTLIVKDAFSISRQKGTSILPLTRRLQLFGPIRQEESSGKEDSWWGMIQNLPHRHFILQHQYRKVPAALQAFNQVVLGSVTETPNPLYHASEQIEVFEVAGTYDEQKRTNEQEGRKVLALLDHAVLQTEGYVPKTGIICATIEQRNLIAGYLLAIKQTRSNGAEQVLNLERNGLDILALEELENHRFDVLILSVTYGMINRISQLTNDFDGLNKPFFTRQIKKVLQLGASKLFLIHSIPTEMLEDYHQETKSAGDKLTGGEILVRFLLFASNIRPGDEAIASAKVYSSRSVSASSLFVKPEIPIFFQQVARLLAAYFESERFEYQVSIQSKVFPLVITSEKSGRKGYVIVADNFMNQQESLSIAWLKDIYSMIQDAGYELMPVWSDKWRENPEKEARLLAGAIIKIEKGI